MRCAYCNKQVNKPIFYDDIPKCGIVVTCFNCSREIENYRWQAAKKTPAIDAGIVGEIDDILRGG